MVVRGRVVVRGRGFSGDGGESSCGDGETEGTTDPLAPFGIVTCVSDDGDCRCGDYGDGDGDRW